MVKAKALRKSVVKRWKRYIASGIKARTPDFYPKCLPACNKIEKTVNSYLSLAMEHGIDAAKKKKTPCSFLSETEGMKEVLRNRLYSFGLRRSSLMPIIKSNKILYMVESR